MKKIVGYLVLVLLLVGVAFLVYKAFLPTPPDFFSRIRLFSRTEEVNLYFFKGEVVIPVVRQVERVRDLEEKLKKVIALLLNGPSEQEKEAGFETALPEGVECLSVFVQDGIAFLNFSPQIESGGGTQTMKARLQQIVYTATQFKDVEKVRFLIDGQPIKYFSSEGLTEVEEPIGRSDLELEER